MTEKVILGIVLIVAWTWVVRDCLREANRHDRPVSPFLRRWD